MDLGNTCPPCARARERAGVRSRARAWAPGGSFSVDAIGAARSGSRARALCVAHYAVAHYPRARKLT